LSTTPLPIRVNPPIRATSVIVDLRNFTPLLSNSGHDDEGIGRFCHFLGQVYSVIIESSLTAIPSRLRADPPVHVNSTGDGALIVFTGEWHFAYGFLAAILLDSALMQRCRLFNEQTQELGLPRTGFGVGVESGTVSRITAEPAPKWPGPIIDAFVGPCINVSARAEGISRQIDKAFTVFADNVIEQVAQALFDENYHDKSDAERACRNDAERHPIHDSKRDLDRKLCITYLHRHHLKGVDHPLPMYRIERSALDVDLPRFRDLLRRLVRKRRDALR
jgi:class 3 adenylate cyclase